MVWDLRGALLKKEERESARLADFEFRHRVRTFRLMAQALQADATSLVRLVARMDDASALAELNEQFPNAEIPGLYERCSAEARVELVRERGNPAPYRLL